MTNQKTLQQSFRFRTGYVLYSIALLAFGAVMGGNIYQIIAEVPNWSADIPNSLTIYREFFHVSHPGYFFQSLVPLIMLCLIVSIFLLWNRPKSVNKWLLITLGGVVLTEAFTVIYFLPRNFTLFLDPIEGIPVDELIETASQWQSANYLRMGMVIITMVGFLKTFQTLSSGERNT